MAFSESKVIVTEIMYDPEGNDNNHEWVEIYNNGEEEIEIVGGDSENSWRFNDGSNHKINESAFLGSMYIQPDEYAILADDPLVFLQDYPDFDGILIDTVMSLSNNGDTVSLSGNNGKDFFESINYDINWGGKNDGNSLQRINDRWLACMPSPGFENYCNNTQITQLTTTTVDIDNEIETTTTTESMCDVGLSVGLDGSSFAPFKKIEYKIKLDNPTCLKTKLLLQHWVEDANKNVVKKKDDSLIELQCKYTKKFQWTPKNPGKFIVKSRIDNVECNDKNDDNNEATITLTVEKLIEKTREKTTKSMQRHISIETKDRAKFGESFILNIIISGENETKLSLDFWVENSKGIKVSDISSLRISPRTPSNNISLPVYLLPACNDDIKHEKYFIKGRGSGIEIYEEVKINKNDSCKNFTREVNKSMSTESNNTFNNTTQKMNFTGYIAKIKSKMLNIFKKLFS